MDPRILSFTASMDRRRGASTEEIEAIFSPLSFNRSSDYLQFISLTNGSDGPDRDRRLSSDLQYARTVTLQCTDNGDGARDSIFLVPTAVAQAMHLNLTSNLPPSLP